MPIETPEMIRKRRVKHALRTAILGAVLALICHALPEEYQGPCKTVVKICSGSL